MNPYATEQKKENSLPPLLVKPGDGAIRRRPGLLSHFITFLLCTAWPAHKFCAEPQATPCAPLCFYCHLYLEKDSTLLWDRDVTNPLNVEMHLCTGAMGLLQVPEGGSQRDPESSVDTLLLRHLPWLEDKKWPNGFVTDRKWERSGRIQRPCSCANTRALEKEVSRDQNKATVLHEVMWPKFLPFST